MMRSSWPCLMKHFRIIQFAPFWTNWAGVNNLVAFVTGNVQLDFVRRSAQARVWQFGGDKNAGKHKRFANLESI